MFCSFVREYKLNNYYHVLILYNICILEIFPLASINVTLVPFWGNRRLKNLLEGLQERVCMINLTNNDRTK